MTCIVAYERDGKVCMGGDSAGVAGYSLCSRGDQKVFRNGEFLIGFTSSFRMGQLLRYKLEPRPIQDWDVEKYLSTVFIDDVRKTYRENGFLQSVNGGSFLLAFRGRIFKVDSDFQVGWNNLPFNAAGCGQDLALGMMCGMHKVGTFTPEQVVKSALEAAEQFSAGVRGPFTLITEDKANG